MNRRAWLVGAAGVVLAALCAWTARTPEAGPLWRVAFVAVALGWSGGLSLVLRQWAPTVQQLAVIATLLRLLLFPLTPTLSDDGYRYVWDGVVQVEDGVSPYRWRPSDPALAHRHGSRAYEEMNSPDYVSVYPPTSQAMFAFGGLFYGWGWEASWYAFKAVTVLAELAGVLALARLVGPAGAALYAWHPLSVVEVAGQGHTEGLLIGALGLVLLGARQRSAWAGAGLALAGWTKLFPFALAPAVLLRGGRWAGAAFVAVAAAFVLPFWGGGALLHAVESLRLYAGTFDFYSLPYRALKSAMYPSFAERAGALAASALTGLWAVGCAGLALTADGRWQSARRATVSVVVLYTLTASTLHPWHWLPLLFVLPLLQNKKPLLWISTVSISTYLAYLWPPAHDLAMVAGWGGGGALAWIAYRHDLLRALMERRARGKWRRLRPFLPALRPGARLLDLGAGEGYVGHVAAADTGAALTAVDVVRYGDAVRPVRLYDGDRLPFADGSFDAALVVFVLHHAERPVRVLSEAVRVTRGPVLVLETVHGSPRQKRWLERVDRLVNRLRSGGGIDEEPLDIRSDGDWRRTFEAEGIQVETVRRWNGLHPQALYRLSGHGATAVSTDSAVAVRASSQTASG